MMRRIVCALACLCAVTVLERSAWAQTAAAPAGHWEGTIETPGAALAIAIDLAARPGDKWEGAITIPAQHVKAFPLADITVKSTAVSFAMKGVPGSPQFSGTVSADGKSIAGQFSQGGGTLPFSVAWKGEAQLEARTKSAPVDKEFEGAWEGTLNANGTPLRLSLTLTNQDGASTGTLLSLDQGAAEIPISSIVQTGSHLKVTIGPIGATYEGDLKDGQITGTWSQGPGTLPLVFSRPAK
jgi:hypothetical protein